MSLANEVKREYPMKALFDSFVAGKRLAVGEVREALNPDADLREQLDRATELIFMLVAANQDLRDRLSEECYDW